VDALATWAGTLAAELATMTTRYREYADALLLAQQQGDQLKADVLLREAGAVENWLRLQWVGIAFIPVTYLHFSDALLATTGRPSRDRGLVDAVVRTRSEVDPWRARRAWNANEHQGACTDRRWRRGQERRWSTRLQGDGQHDAARRPSQGSDHERLQRHPPPTPFAQLRAPVLVKVSQVGAGRARAAYDELNANPRTWPAVARSRRPRALPV
jgi:hypothetical protein